MSLLADLLAKITKQPESKREVPPNLRSIVRSSARQSGNRRKIILLACIFIAAVISGLLLTRFGRTLLETETTIRVPVRGDTAKPDVRLQQEHEKTTAVSEQQAAIPDRTPAEAESAASGIVSETGGEPAAVPKTPDTEPAPIPAKVEVKQTDAPVTTADRPEEKETRSETKHATKRDAFLYTARKYEMDGDYLRALSNYKYALSVDPDNFTVMNNIAYMYLMLNLPDEAAAYARMALDRNRDYVPALINIAIAQAQSGSYIDAERYLNDAANIEQDNETVLLNLAVLHERQKNFPRALELYSHLGKLGNIEGYMGAARIHEMQGNGKKAVELYKTVANSDTAEDTVRIKAKKRIMILLNKK